MSKGHALAMIEAAGKALYGWHAPNGPRWDDLAEVTKRAYRTWGAGARRGGQVARKLVALRRACKIAITIAAVLAVVAVLALAAAKGVDL